MAPYTLLPQALQIHHPRVYKLSRQRSQIFQVAAICDRQEHARHPYLLASIQAIKLEPHLIGSMHLQNALDSVQGAILGVTFG